MDYHIFREIADSWVLLAMFLFFLVVVAWVYLRPGASRNYEDTASIPFRHEDKPATGEHIAGNHLKEARQ